MVAILGRVSLRRGAVGLATVVGLGLPWAAVKAQPLASSTGASASAAFTAAESLEGNYLSAYIAVAARDTTAAAAFYREALKEDPANPELLERAFVSLLADGDVAGAARAAERLTGREGTNAFAQLALGVRALKAKQYTSARTILARGGKGRAADLLATLLTAWSYAGSRDAKRALDTVAGIKGELAFGVFRDYHAGLIAELVGNEVEAEARLKAAYDAEKTTLRIVDAYGRLQARKGQGEAALATYRAYETGSQRHPFVRYAMDQLAAGKPLPSFIQTPQDGAAEVLYGLGSAGSRSGDELLSIIYLRLALYLNPDHSLALVTLSEAFERMRRTEQSIEVLRRVPAASPLKASAEIKIGLSLEQLGRGDEALRELERLTAARPDDTEALIALGSVQRSRKNYAEAAEVYGRAIERSASDDPALWVLHYYRGTAYERAKDWPKAELDLKKALELVPEAVPLGRSQVLNYLGYSWVDQNLNLDEAFKMLKRAVELNPRDGMIIDSLGWAYYRFGRYEEAVRELETAAELKSGDPVINDHLGDAYWHVGRKLEATFQWQHAKDSNPEPDDLKKIEEKLLNGLPEITSPAEARNLPGEERPATEPTRSGG